MEEEEIQGLEPEIEPETCNEGGNGEVECEPNWDYQNQVWICLTCGKHL